MVTDDEKMHLLTRLNEARAIFGNRMNEGNELAMRIDLEEIDRMAKQFPDFELPQFERAIVNALQKQKETRASMEAHNQYTGNLSIDVMHVVGQCHVIKQAMSAGKTQLALETPKVEPKTFEQWLAEDFPERWAAMKAEGDDPLGVVPVLRYGLLKEIQAAGYIMPLRRALAQHPDFSQVEADIARQDAQSILYQSLKTECASVKMSEIGTQRVWAAGALPPPKATREQVQACINLLNAAVDAANKNAVKKLVINAQREIEDAFDMAMINCYGRLACDKIVERQAVVRPLNTRSLVNNLNDLD